MKYRVILALVIVASQEAQAASFDCRKAIYPDEIAVCHNPRLNDKDVKMATTYQLLIGLFAMGMRGSMMDAQSAWLKERAACQSNVSCLNQRYDERLAALDKIYAGINKPL